MFFDLLEASYSAAEADFSVLKEHVPCLLPGDCKVHPAQHKEAAEDVSGTRLVSVSLCCSSPALEI